MGRLEKPSESRWKAGSRRRRKRSLGWVLGMAKDQRSISGIVSACLGNDAKPRRMSVAAQAFVVPTHSAKCAEWVGHPAVVVARANSRFPAGMTDRKARTTARAKAKADSPEGNDRKKSKSKSNSNELADSEFAMRVLR